MQTHSCISSCSCGFTFDPLSQVTRHGDAYQNASAEFLTGPCEALAQSLLTNTLLLGGENDLRFLTIYGDSGRRL